VGIDRATYFERCCPNSKMTAAFDYQRLFEANDEAIVTYEATRTDGRRFRNTEIFGFGGDKISRVEVYFGWESNERDLGGRGHDAQLRPVGSVQPSSQRNERDCAHEQGQPEEDHAVDEHRGGGGCRWGAVHDQRADQTAVDPSEAAR